MKKYALLAAGLILAASTAADAAVHIVGGGTPDSNNTYPFVHYFPAIRWQTLWYQSELGEPGPVVRVEWQMRSDSGGEGGFYRNCDILLCHTGIPVVTSSFVANYDGNTPVNVFTGTYVLLATSPDEWVTLVEPKNFTYNNKDNLLIEISWRGSTVGTNHFKVRTRGSPPFPRRVWNETSKTATTGTVGVRDYHHYGRITISASGVEPTSLGRVKSIFK